LKTVQGRGIDTMNTKVTNCKINVTYVNSTASDDSEWLTILF